MSIWFLVGKSLPFLSPLLYQIKIIRYARAALDPFHYPGRKDSRPLCAAPYKDSRRPYLCPLGLSWRPALIRIGHTTSSKVFLFWACVLFGINEISNSGPQFHHSVFAILSVMPIYGAKLSRCFPHFSLPRVQWCYGARQDRQDIQH